MSITVAQADVTNVAPELASEGAGRVATFIAIATGMVSEDQWGTDKANYAVTLLTCHLITMVNRGARASGAGGAITELKTGDMQQSFGPEMGTSDVELAATNYGKLFLALRRTIVTTPLVI